MALRTFLPRTFNARTFSQRTWGLNYVAESIVVEAIGFARANAEAIGFDGQWEADLVNGQQYRGGLFRLGRVSPRLCLRLATDPEVSGNLEGTPITRADIDTITVTAWSCTPNAVGVRNYGDPIAGYNALELTSADVVFDEMQPWRDDSIGFNFAWSAPADVWEDAEDGDYGKLRITCTLLSGVVLEQDVEGKLLT